MNYHKNQSTIKFKIQMPEMTGKTFQYRYQKKLTDYALAYMKNKHRGAKLYNWRDMHRRFSNEYDYAPYLCLTITVGNGKNEHSVVDVDAEEMCII